MKILGLGYGYHDASSCLIEDGEVKWLIEEDRYTYIKHDSNFPKQSLEALFKNYNISHSDIDCIVYGENPYKKFNRILKDIIIHTPFSYKEFISFGKEWLGSKLWSIYQIANYFNKPISCLMHLDHHLSHALSAHYTSGNKNSLSIVIDAVGEETSLSIYQFKEGQPLGDLLSKESYKDSLCLLYSLITHFLGFKPNDSECTTMALAAYGEPNYKDKLKQIISHQSGKIVLNKDIIDFSSLKTDKLINSISKTLGISPRNLDEEINIKNISPRVQELANLAASIQELYEEILCDYISYYQKITGDRNLTISGGGAQNCKFISKLYKLNIFQNIYIPPTPGDNGLSLGAAIFGLIKKNASPYVKINFDLGAQTQFEDIENIVSSISYEDIKSYSLDEIPFKEIRKTKLSKNKLAESISKKVMNDEIIALVYGRSECGPRALGHRSIICRADNIEVAKKLSTKVKKRAPFRPYAVTTEKEFAQNIFESYQDDSCARWMQTAYKVKEEYRSSLRACLHKDNTTRPQVLAKYNEDILHFVLQDLKKNGESPIVLNTSLNESGYPLAKGAKEAFLIFLKTAIDSIVIDDYLIEKIR